jgi:hypothetical protein
VTCEDATAVVNTRRYEGQHQSCRNFLSALSPTLPQQPQMEETGGGNLRDMRFYRKLRIEQNAEVWNNVDWRNSRSVNGQ